MRRTVADSCVLISLLFAALAVTATGCTAPTSPAPAGSAAKSAATSSAATSRTAKGAAAKATVRKSETYSLQRRNRDGERIPLTSASATAATAATAAAPEEKRLIRVAFDQDKIKARAIQVALMARELAPYWHADVEGRVPVRILKNAQIPEAATFQLLGQPAVVDTADKLTGPAHVVINSVALDASPNGVMRVDIAFELPAEWVRASGVLVGEAQRWRVESMQVVEK